MKLNLKNMQIGKLSLLMISGIILFTSCSNDEESTTLESLNGIWNVKNISGGIAGINDDYDDGTITWTFTNQMLTVENNESQGNLYSGFESGTYNYTVSEINGFQYIFINNVEFGSYALATNSLIIDQNETSSGAGADGFILQLER
uniref:hypothetical protein n=2 Tax=Flavobacterium sp. TaxID=239 RepID=UPI00404AB5B8